MTVEGHLPPPVRSWRDLTPREQEVDLVAMGASAGGVEALATVVSDLPRDLGAAVLVVLHVAETGTSVLPAILDRAGPLPATTALDGEPIHPGRICIAPPNHHLTVEGSTLRVLQGPRENGHRPAVDPLFRTAALAYGRRMAAVVLSGARDDGTSGLRQVKLRGGAALVQDPDDALYPGMPHSAMTHVPVDAVLPLREIAPALTRLCDRIVHSDPRGGASVSDSHAHASPDEVEAGQSSRFTCPDCGGVLWEFRDGTVDRFRCAVGHAYSIESLVGEQTHQLESALWAAVRTLEDRALLLRRMERQSRSGGAYRSAEAFERRARDAAERATVIRDAVEGVSDVPTPDEREGASDTS